MMRFQCQWAERTALIGVLLTVASCAAGPKVPDWSIDALGHVERFEQAYLKGDTRVQKREFELARSVVARTGRPELVARVELTRCAVEVASLVFEPCTGFEPLRADAGAAERAYAHYLAGQELDTKEQALLPAQHRLSDATTLPATDQPLVRLIKAGVLLRRTQASPQIIEQAVETASAQGWRRPLLAWLGVQAKLADERGQTQEAARIRRRMELVAPSPSAHTELSK